MTDRRFLVAGALFLLLGVAQCANPIAHTVILMLENRSFDHMLGWLKANNTQIDGLTGAEYNLVDPSDPSSARVYVNGDSPYKDPDPCHSVDCTTQQVFGAGPISTQPPPMSGFVFNGNKHMKGQGAVAMSMFTPRTVPVISTLAQEFALFDKWYASIPGPTEVNRMYSQSGTSYGSCINTNWTQIIPGYPQRTIFQALDEAKLSWHVYFQDFPSQLYFRYVRGPAQLFKFKLLRKFYEDAANGTLPTVSYIEPRYFEDFGMPANDQHPSHDVSEGERLIKSIYEALRNGPGWNRTMFIITYDEHGGFYDHDPTPVSGVPPADNLVCPNTDPPFKFDRLGVRIPTIAISPWINKGTLEHDPAGPTPTSKYDHTSVLATLRKLYGLPGMPFTKRDAWAGSFDHILAKRTSPRTDCPTRLPSPPSLRLHPLTGERPASDLHLSFAQLAAAVNGVELSSAELQSHPALQTEGQARAFVQEHLERFFGRSLSDEAEDGEDKKQE